jgi:hypothetical protein
VQASNKQKAVDAAWPAIKKAVEEGLKAAGGGPTLDKVVPVVPDADAGVHVEVTPRRRVVLGARVRSYDVRSDTLEFEHRLSLPASDLGDRADDIEAWAAAARRYERDEVLRRLTDAAGQDRYTKARVFALANAKTRLAGFGDVRLVRLAGSTKVTKELKDAGWPGDIVDVGEVDGLEAKALLFHVGGGPLIRRASDLTLGWDDAGDGNVDLLLTERLRLDRARPNARPPAAVELY